MTLRHIISINDLTNEEIAAVFSLAARYLAELGDPEIPYRIARSNDACRGSVMATLFYEPSTRTRLSFESSMARLGGSVISSADPKASSAVKGESLADSIRIVSAYADIIVLRHPREGAAKLAAEFATVPIINGGDGAHEHPTQTLCDLFTMQREKGALAGLNVAILGDLKGGRTAHSLVYALARFGATITTMPAGGLDLPESVDWRLRNEFGYRRVSATEPSGAGRTAAYLPQGKADTSPDIDVLYVTRFQKERTDGTAAAYPVVNAAFLARPAFGKALVMHPLPRVDELDPALDAEPRAAYFRQASHGVPIRMALTALLLGQGEGLDRLETGQRTAQRCNTVCANANCISRDATEAQNAPAKFLAVADGRLRCFYCEHDALDAR